MSDAIKLLSIELATVTASLYRAHTDLLELLERQQRLTQQLAIAQREAPLTREELNRRLVQWRDLLIADEGSLRTLEAICKVAREVRAQGEKEK